jgi:uncharacterized MAPEG superfamily protein
MLLWSVVSGAGAACDCQHAANRNSGIAYHLGPRDTPAKAPLGIIAGGFLRAFANFCKTFALFAASVLLVAVLNKHDQTSAVGDQLYFFRRLIYFRSMPWASPWCAQSSGPSRSPAW